MKRSRWILILLLCLGVCPALQAQVGDHRNDFAVGVNGGYVMSKVEFNPTLKQQYHTGGTWGLTLRYTSEKYFACYCALQAEVNYTQAGWQEVIEQSEDTYARDLQFIQIPLLARLAMGKERGGFQGFLVLGPQVGFCIGDKERKTGPWNQTSLASRPNGRTEQYGLDVQNKFEYGITGGLGVEVSTRRGHRFALEGRYYYGLGDLFNNSKKDPFGKSSPSAIYIKLSYLVDLIKTK